MGGDAGERHDRRRSEADRCMFGGMPGASRQARERPVAKGRAAAFEHQGRAALHRDGLQPLAFARYKAGIEPRPAMPARNGSDMPRFDS